MFRFMAQDIGNPFPVLITHPTQLVNYAEWFWLLNPDAVPQVPLPAAPIAPPLLTPAFPTAWHTLIYPYLIENTRAFEIFARLVRECLHGERLGVVPPAAQIWLRNTEELFFRNPPLFSIYSAHGQLRDDTRAMRRNAYYRMFGMDLNHGTDENRPYPYEKPAAANRDFVGTLEEFLREIWVAISNILNVAGTNPTDDGTIATLANKLQNMLTIRRLSGNISREEFYAVATMSWFHLTLGDVGPGFLQFNSPIVQALQADATSTYDRLQKLGERVGLPPHPNARSYFLLAEPLSQILTQVETGPPPIPPPPVGPPSGVPANPWTPADVGPFLYGLLQPQFQTTIAEWSIATGRNLKLKKVEVVTAGGVPVAVQ